MAFDIKKIKEDLAAGDLEEARQKFSSLALNPHINFKDLIALSRLLPQLKAQEEKLKVTVLSELTLDYLVPLVQTFFLAYGISTDVRFNTYGTLISSLLELSGKEAEPGRVIVLHTALSLKDRLADGNEGEFYRSELLRALETLAQKRERELLVTLPEDSPDALLGLGLEVQREKHRESIRNAVGDQTQVLNLEFLKNRNGNFPWFDWPLFYSAKIPFSMEAHVVIARHLVLRCLNRARQRKVLVLDLDNTLWGGVLGDAGVEGIQVGLDDALSQAFWQFQRQLAEIKSCGILLAIASKNEESLVREIFEKRPDMPLKLADFSAMKINWNPKSENILEMAQELNLPADSFVFLDDSPSEIEEVWQRVPEVEAYLLPEDPANYTSYLARHVSFETGSLSEEDKIRTELYQSEKKRQEILKTHRNYEDYLKSLNMVATLNSISEDQLDRVEQLIQKTNQFNVTTRRHSRKTIEDFCEIPHSFCRSLALEDRLGPMGLVSVILAFPQSEKVLEIDSWVMSCRVFKRGVEDFLFNALCSWAQRAGFEQIAARYLPTKKNAPVRDLFDRLGFALESETGGEKSYTLTLRSFKENKHFINVLADQVS